MRASASHTEGLGYSDDPMKKGTALKRKRGDPKAPLSVSPERVGA